MKVYMNFPEGIFRDLYLSELDNYKYVQIVRKVEDCQLVVVSDWANDSIINSFEKDGYKVIIHKEFMTMLEDPEAISMEFE